MRRALVELRWLADSIGYRWRPYCWRLDDRHVWWRHRRCRCLLWSVQR